MLVRLHAMLFASPTALIYCLPLETPEGLAWRQQRLEPEDAPGSWDLAVPLRVLVFVGLWLISNRAINITDKHTRT